MIFKEFRENMYSNKEGILINKNIIIQGIESLILGFTKEKENNKLWVLYRKNKNHEYNDVEEERHNFFYTTNRELLKEQVRVFQEEEHIHFKEMIIQNQKCTFDSSYLRGIENLDYESMNTLRHFIEEELVPKDWECLDVRDIMIASYDQKLGEQLPKIDYNKNIDIILRIEKRSKEVLVEYPLTFRLGKSDKDTKIYYFNKGTNEEEFFYLNSIEKCDIWKEVEDDFDTKIYNNIDYMNENEKEKYKNEYIKACENICPRDKDLVNIYYETMNNNQLRFFTKEYLDSKPIYNENSGSFAITLGYRDEEGINGYIKSVENLKAVDKDFDGKIEVELFSKFIDIPVETIYI